VVTSYAASGDGCGVVATYAASGEACDSDEGLHGELAWAHCPGSIWC
jgi:hypothetical protein